MDWSKREGMDEEERWFYDQGYKDGLKAAEKPGEWETKVRTIRGHKIAFFACSVCGKNADDEYRYCPTCGAKMESE